VFSSKYRFQHISGNLLIIFGIVAITLAILITPIITTTYLYPDHSITLGGIKQLNGYRFISSLVGILLIISGSVLMTVKNLETTLQRIMAFFHFGILDEKKTKRTEPVFVALFIVLFGIIAFVLMLWITPYGSGVSPDSTTYIGGAKSILSGKGFFINGSPITHFPPLYPLFLAATNLLENNLVQAARILNAFLFGINVGLIALAIYLTAGRNFLTTTFAVFFFLSSAPLLELHAWAWSEPLFITFSLACIILLCLYVNRPTLSLLIASSLSLGFALVTRYIGIAFLPAVLVIVFFSGSGRHFGRRFWNTLICLVLICAPLVIFFVRNMIVAGSATDRSFALHLMPVLNYVTQLIEIVFNFIAPISLPAGVRPAIFGLIAAFIIAQIIILFKRHRRDINWRSVNWRSMGIMMPVSCLLFSVSYLLFLFISISFLDASTPVDTRLLSPILVLLIVGVFSAIWTVSQTLKKPVVWLCFLFLISIAVLMKTPEAIRSAAAIQENGLGYTSRQWQNSESMAFVKLLPNDVMIYSNGADILGFLTEKQSLSIPAKTSSGTMEANSLYNEEIDAMCKDIIIEKGALLVYFNQVTWRWYLPTQEEVASTCKLPVLQNFGDGTVFGDISK
jgi:hypothetical protein